MILTVTLLQDIRVVALDETVAPTGPNDPAAGQVEEVDAEPTASTATLEVSPEHAQMLTTADKYGILRMIIRPVNDTTTPAVQPTLIIAERAS
jgi:Flp pilus assembly protein CpaB